MFTLHMIDVNGIERFHDQIHFGNNGLNTLSNCKTVALVRGTHACSLCGCIVITVFSEMAKTCLSTFVQCAI